MNVELVGHTVFNVPGVANTAWTYPEDEEGVLSSDILSEFAGRACYQSWSRPNPATATNQGYMQNILFQEHESVLEHASATFYVTGVSRNLTHELVRHRHLSFSELSQRFVDMKDAELIRPPAYEEAGYEVAGWGTRRIDNAFNDYEYAVIAFTALGLNRKQAREAARAELPSCMETKIVVTGNHRAWREVLKKRGSLHADAEIRELSVELYNQLYSIAPNTYQDFRVKTAKDGRLWLKKKKMKQPVAPTTEEPLASWEKRLIASTKAEPSMVCSECGKRR